MQACMIAVTLGLQVAAVYLVIRAIRRGSRHWVWGGMAMVALVLLGQTLVPVWELLFFDQMLHFDPAEDLESFLISLFFLLLVAGVGRLLEANERSMAQLRRNERRYRLSFERAGIAMAVVLPGGLIQRANAAFARLTGYAVHEIENQKTWTDIFDCMPGCGSGKPVRPGWNRCGRELSFKDRGGQQQDVFVEWEQLEDADTWLASVTNLANVREVQRRQEEVSDGLHAVVEIADELIASDSLDELYRKTVELAREKLGVERCAIFCNEGSILRGTYGTDMNGRTTREHDHEFAFRAEWTPLYTIKPGQTRRWTLQETMRYEWDGNHELELTPGWVATTAIARPGGPPIAIFFNDSAISNRPVDPVRQEIIALTCSLVAQIHERKQAETDRLVSERKLRGIFSAMQDVIIVLDSDGRYLEIAPTNPKLLYRPPADIIGRTVEEVFPEQGKQFLSYIHAVLHTQRPLTEEYCLSIDNRDYWFSATISPLAEKRVIMVARDVTERVEREDREANLQQQLTRARRMESLGVLAGGVAHDLNNILGPIVAFPDLLLARLPEAFPMRSEVSMIKEAAMRAAAVIRDLLTLSRRAAYPTRAVDLVALVKTYQASAGYQEIQKQHPKLTVDTRGLSEPVLVQGSEPHLAQALMNLVINASEAFTEREKARIEISVRREKLDEYREYFETIPPGSYGVLRVEDNGTGIASRDLEHIFEPFFTRKELGRSGTGLGLAVVYGVVKDLSGYIHVSSRLGRGTVFELYFPSSDVSEVPVKKVEEKEPVVGGEYILVVDDLPSQRLLASSLLESLGYEVATAENGHVALERLAEREADLVILDMIMEEGFDGLDTYRAMLKKHPGLPCILASGYSESDRVKEARRLGAGAFIAKPYTLRDLGRAVRVELDRAKAG